MTPAISFPSLADCLPSSLGIGGAKVRLVEHIPSPPPGTPRLTRFIDGDSSEAWVLIEDVARWRILAGSTMEALPLAGSSPERVSCMSMATPLCVMILQRDEMPMHAACLVAPREESTTLICAASGTGKSTTSAALAMRGWTMLSDDLTHVVREGDVMNALPGWSTIKLWPGACEILGLPAESLPGYPGLKDKRLWRPPRIGSSPCPIGRVVLLDRAPTADRVEIRSLRGVQAVAALRAQGFRPQLIDRFRKSPVVFDSCTRLARQADVFLLTAPTSMHPNLVAEAIEVACAGADPS